MVEGKKVTLKINTKVSHRCMVGAHWLCGDTTAAMANNQRERGAVYLDAAK